MQEDLKAELERTVKYATRFQKQAGEERAKRMAADEKRQAAEEAAARERKECMLRDAVIADLRKKLAATATQVCTCTTRICLCCQ